MNTRRAASFLIAGTIGALAAAAHSEPPARNPSLQSGEITLEDTTERKKNPYQTGQDGAIEYMQNLLTTATALKERRPGAPGLLPDAAVNHLAWVYLFCTVRSGSCPLVLDAVLEVDVMNAKLGLGAGCPTMERFWKVWVRDDMEKRQKYLVRTANLVATSEFTQNQRPRYLKCRDTVRSETAGAAPSGDFFAERYGAPTGPYTQIAKLASLLTELKTKVPNIMTALEAER